MATIRLVPSTYYLSSYTYLSASDVDNMYTNTDSSTYGTFTHNRASTNTYYAYLRNFNIDDVPSEAIVTAFTIKIKASATGHTTSSSATYALQLCNKNTSLNIYAPGRITTLLNTFTFPQTSITWSDIVNYGADFGIRIPLRRASSSTEDVVSVYGAEIEVEYTVPVSATVTTTLSGSGTISPSGTTSTYEGNEFELTITPTNKSDTVTVTQDGVDITSQLVAHGAGGSVSAVPADVTTHSIQNGSSYAQYAVGHSAEDPSSSGTSSNMYAPSGSTGYAEYTFDLSGMPSGAVIESVTAVCYGHRESSTIDSSHVSNCGLYDNGTLIVDDDFPSTSNSEITLTTDDVSSTDITIRHTVGYYGGLVLGITLTVVYSTGTGLDHYTYTYTVTGNSTIAVVIGGGVQSDKVYAKDNGAWVEVGKVYEKVNGTWTEISTTRLQTIMETKKVVKG